MLADPGRCVRTFGTREDYLVPSACLNSTVSGLVSRTVLNDRLIAPGQFHGAKFYADLAPVDLSRRFLDEVTACFEDVAARCRRGRGRPHRRPAGVVHGVGRGGTRQRALRHRGREPRQTRGGGDDPRPAAPRIPWRVLVRLRRNCRTDDLAHVRLLADQRGVVVEEVPGLSYSAIGLIHPRFTRGATGADGRAV